MTGSFQSGRHAGKFRFTDRTVGSHVIAAIFRTGRILIVLLYSLTFRMGKLINFMRCALQYCITHRAVNDFIIAALGCTGCRNDVFLYRITFLMAGCLDGLGLLLITASTGSGQNAVRGTFYRSGNDAFVPIVTQGLNDSNLCCFVANAAVSGLAALCCTGRRFVYREVFGIVMAGSFQSGMYTGKLHFTDRTVGSHVIAAVLCTGRSLIVFLHSCPFRMGKLIRFMRCALQYSITHRAVNNFIVAALGCTGCRNDVFLYRITFLMTGCLDCFGLLLIAASTGSGQNTVSRTGRRCGDNTFVPIVTQGLDNSNIRNAVAGAAMSGLAALCCTGRRFVYREVFGIVMAGSF